MARFKFADIQQEKQAVDEVFSRAAATYDNVGPRFFSYFGRRLVMQADLHAGFQVLDVAMGRGAVLFPATEAVGPQGGVQGIDLSVQMVEQTRLEIAQRALPNLQVQPMDAEALCFPDGMFDRVLCGFALFFFPQLDRAMAEVWRVLRPGGRFAVSTWGPDDERWEWRDQLYQAYLPRPTQPEEKPEIPPEQPVFDTPEGMTAIMTVAGFTHPRVTIEEVDFVYADEEEWWQTQWSHGARRGVEAIRRYHGEIGLRRFKAEALEKLQSLRQPDGFHQRFRALYTVADKAED